MKKRMNAFVLSALAASLAFATEAEAMRTLTKITPVMNKIFSLKNIVNKDTVHQFLTHGFAVGSSWYKNNKKTSWTIGAGLLTIGLLGTYKYFKNENNAYNNTAWHSDMGGSAINWSFTPSDTPTLPEQSYQEWLQEKTDQKKIVKENKGSHELLIKNDVTVNNEKSKLTAKDIRKNIKTQTIETIVEPGNTEHYNKVVSIVEQYLNNYKDENFLTNNFNHLLEDAIDHVKFKLKTN